MPRTVSQSQPRTRRAAGRNAILQVAAETFRSKGFDRATMEDLAARLGFLKASLYYYFKSKHDILDEIIRGSRQEVLRRMEEVAASDLSAVDKLRQAIVVFVTSFDYHYPALSVAVYERLDRGVPAIDEMQSIRRRVQELWDQIIGEAASAGAIRTDLDLHVVSFGIIGMCNWLSRWYDKDGRLPPDEIARVFAEMVLNGLVAGPSQTAPARGGRRAAARTGKR